MYSRRLHRWQRLPSLSSAAISACTAVCSSKVRVPAVSCPRQLHSVSSAPRTIVCLDLLSGWPRRSGCGCRQRGNGTSDTVAPTSAGAACMHQLQRYRLAYHTMYLLLDWHPA
jgi:hypothetical protein